MATGIMSAGIVVTAQRDTLGRGNACQGGRVTAAAGKRSRTELQTVTATVCIARLVVFSGLPSFASAELLERGRASFPRGAGTARGPRTGRMGRTGFAR